MTIRLINDYPVDGDAGMPVIRLPDIAFGAEAWALVELEIPAGLAVECRAAAPGRRYRFHAGRHPSCLYRCDADAGGLPVSAWEALLPDALVVTRRAELAAGQLLEQARPLPNMATGTQSSGCSPRPVSALPTSPG